MYMQLHRTFALKEALEKIYHGNLEVGFFNFAKPPPTYSIVAASFTLASITHIFFRNFCNFIWCARITHSSFQGSELCVYVCGYKLGARPGLVPLSSFVSAVRHVIIEQKKLPWLLLLELILFPSLRFTTAIYHIAWVQKCILLLIKSIDLLLPGRLTMPAFSFRYVSGAGLYDISWWLGCWWGEEDVRRRDGQIHHRSMLSALGVHPGHHGHHGRPYSLFPGFCAGQQAGWTHVRGAAGRQ